MDFFICDTQNLMIPYQLKRTCTYLEVLGVVLVAKSKAIVFRLVWIPVGGSWLKILARAFSYSSSRSSNDFRPFASGAFTDDDTAASSYKIIINMLP